MTLVLEDVTRDALTAAYELHEKHLNRAFVTALRGLGMARSYVRGQGAHLYDTEGRKHLDLIQGFGVFAIGRNHPVVKEALKSAIDSDSASLVQMDADPLAGVLARELVRRAPGLERVFFCSSGTEAIEACIKLARIATKRAKLVFCDDGFHGLTFGSLSLCGIAPFRAGCGPLLPDCVSVPYGDADALAGALRSGDVAAFVVEPIQGSVAFTEADAAYWKRARELCTQHGTALVLDEVFTGLGRTGKWFAYEHFAIEPDMVAIAKALSGGFVPVGAVLARASVFDRVFTRERPLAHGSTFSKNRLAMAAGIATLHVLESEGLVERAAVAGAALIARLREIAERHTLVTGVRGRGMLLGLDLEVPDALLALSMLRNHRVLMPVMGATFARLVPPLTLADEDADWLCTALDDTLAQLATTRGARAHRGGGRTP